MAAGAEFAVNWSDGVVVPGAYETVTQGFLAEALRNANKHAKPTRVDVRVDGDEETLRIEVRNDGVADSERGAGMGLRLAAFEAIQHGGTVEFGPSGAGWWRARMVLPL